MGVGDETSKGMIGEKAMLDFVHVLHQRPALLTEILDNHALQCKKPTQPIEDVCNVLKK